MGKEPLDSGNTGFGLSNLYDVERRSALYFDSGRKYSLAVIDLNSFDSGEKYTSNSKTGGCSRISKPFSAGTQGRHPAGRALSLSLSFFCALLSQAKLEYVRICWNIENSQHVHVELLSLPILPDLLMLNVPVYT